MAAKSAKQTILIVEDSDDDYDATIRALNKGKNFVNPLQRCENGQEALDYLFGRGRYAPPSERARPGLILLDLNMPGIDGRQVLAELKSDPALRKIPVIVMTTSNDERDIEESYRIGANSYIVKPLDWEGFFNAIARLKDYWLEIAVLPGPNK